MKEAPAAVAVPVGPTSQAAGTVPVTRKDPIKLARTASRPTDTTTSPAALLTVALLGGIGYLGYRWWKKNQESRAAEEEAIKQQRQAAASTASGSKSKGGKSSFTFDKQAGSGTSTSGRGVPSSSRSRPQEKPKTQKQLRKEAKEAKKAAKKQGAADVLDASVTAAIAKRAKELGMGAQPPPEPEKQYHVDYEGVARGFDKIVEWQATGKKKY